MAHWPLAIWVFLAALGHVTATSITRCPRAPRSLPPRITLKRRILSGFVKGGAPYIKLLYISDTPVQVTWFREAHRADLPNSDEKDMLEVAAESGYSVSSLASWNVKATTLRISRDVYDNEKLFKVVTKWEFEEAGISYRLQTEVQAGNTDSEKLDSLHGIAWLIRPNITITYEHSDSISFPCTAQAGRQSKDDELILYHTKTQDHGTQGFKIDGLNEAPLAKVHKGDTDQETNNKLTQTRSDILYCLKRRPTPQSNFTARYVLNYTILQAQSDKAEGLYVCAMNKQDYSSHASIIVKRYGGESAKPRVRMEPCQTGMFNNINQTLLMEEGQETCLLCQGYGDPNTNVTLMRAGDLEVRRKRNILVRKHRNVESGGLAEAVYTFLNPQNTLADEYECVVSVRKSGRYLEARFKFHIAVIPRPNN